MSYNWGDGLAAQPQVVSQFPGISDASIFFEQVVTRPYANRVIVGMAAAMHWHFVMAANRSEGTQSSPLGLTTDGLILCAGPHVYGPAISGATGSYSGSALFQRLSQSCGYLNKQGYCAHSTGQCHQFPVVFGEFGSRLEDPRDVAQASSACSSSWLVACSRDCR